MIIRAEKPEDYAQVYQIISQAFEQDNESRLVEKLRQSNHYIPELSLVATKDSQVIGHILFSKIQIIGDTQTHESLALAPMAVHPQFQKQGIGGKLITRGLSEAKKLGYESVVVLGHAQYYPRFGFTPASQWNIRCPFEVPDEAYMALELQEDSLKDKSGIVKYADAFGEV